jgi:hypothetical protein
MLSATLHVAHIVATHPRWLASYTEVVLNTLCLIVYQSPLLEDTDEIFRPVQEFLDRHPVSFAFREVIPDPMMMFGKGEFAVYIVRQPGIPAPTDALIEGIKRLVLDPEQKVVSLHARSV